MFGGGGDPFARMIQMHSQMEEMDRMMNAMMDPFGMLNSRQQMIDNGSRSRNGYQPQQRQAAPHNMMMSPFQSFGFPDIFSQMNGLAEMAMNDPNSVCYSQSTMISMDGSGRPRVVEHSTRKSGDVKETRRMVRDGDEEEMVIGHTIGDREHVLEKKRDKDGKVRRQQRFRNLDETEAEQFDREFAQRAERNLREGFGGYGGFGGGGQRRNGAIDDGRREGRSGGARTGGAAAPIITLPDDDDFEQPVSSRTANRPSTSGGNGPIIREISEEEAEQSIPKRRKDMFGKYFRANDQ